MSDAHIVREFIATRFRSAHKLLGHSSIDTVAELLEHHYTGTESVYFPFPIDIGRKDHSKLLCKPHLSTYGLYTDVIKTVDGKIFLRVGITNKCAADRENRINEMSKNHYLLAGGVYDKVWDLPVLTSVICGGDDEEYVTTKEKLYGQLAYLFGTSAISDNGDGYLNVLVTE